MRFSTACLLLGSLLLSAAASDLDSGHDAIGAAKMVESTAKNPQEGDFGPELIYAGWIRLRGVDLAKETETRQALAKLHDRGLKTCVLLRWPADWRGAYLPKDLREAYDHGQKMGMAYSDLVDAWEVDNEPDLASVPEAAENYAAFLKAMYLGLKAGSREQGAGRQNNLQVSGFRSQVSAQASLVIMAALGLPPGPWLDRFSANDGFNYTDGFNYHYYGYAEDFTAVYRQHATAVAELSAKSYELGGPSTKNQERLTFSGRQDKSLPIFLTEIGYGMLGKQARDTKEGRLRQWRWFKSVGEQTAKLRIEAPMAFYLPPYLEYDTLEFGLTVPAKPNAKSEGQGAESRTPTSELWTAGGITYIVSDFGVHAAEPWMTIIGKEIGGNQITPALAEWVGQRAKSRAQEEGSRSWTVATAKPSPVVIDFLAGEDLQPLKRYNGTFVTGNVSPGMKPEAGKPMLPPVARPPKPLKPPRSEEFMIHIRTANGNLYEVYPTRMATPEWQHYLEQQGNFTMSFYGRAELPWRFKDNKPVSLVVVMYPKQLPATYEFKRVQLIRLREAGHEKAQKDTIKPALNRYGQGKVVLYNFSDKPVTGKLLLPLIFTADLADKADEKQSVESVQSVAKDIGPITLAAGERRPVVAEAMAGSSSPSTGPRAGEESLELQPGERRELNVIIKVPAERFERTEATFTFVPDDAGIPQARFVTEFFPAMEGLKTTVVAALLQQKPETGNRKPESSAGEAILTNREISSSRQLATEEAKGILQPATGFLVQQGAIVERAADGFRITVTGLPPGKEQRVEVEIPWPEEERFAHDRFLSLEYRLRALRPE